MSQPIITLAFEQYKAQQEAVAASVELDEFVLANVPNQDASLPIDRNEGLPPQAQIVFFGDVSQAGYVNPNAVVYSLIMDTTIGDFNFNWIGLRNKASGIIAAISHIPTVHKLKTVLGVQNGNSVTRSIMMSYSDAKGLTNIDVDASTWQIDFTARLFGMDEAERLANIDVFGQAAFLNDGYQVIKSGSSYITKQGVGYVSGLRCYALHDVTVSEVGNSMVIYLDASWQGGLTSQWQTVVSIKASTQVLTDYVDSTGLQHYVTKLADITSAGNVIDLRLLGGTPALERKDNAATNSDIDNSSSADKHVKLTQLWRGISNKIMAAFQVRTISTTSPLKGGGNLSANRTFSIDNASTAGKGVVQLTDSITSTSSVLAATAKAVKAAYDLAVSKITKTQADSWYLGKAANANTATKLSTTRKNYNGITDSNVVGQLMWKQYGNAHTIFDASAGTTPTGNANSNKDSDRPWQPKYPTLMGYDGESTFGVRVDSARTADTASKADTVGVKTLDSKNFYNATWHSGDMMYSCSSGDGFSYRPSDGFSKIKHGYIAGEYLHHQSDGKLVAHNTDKRTAGIYGVYDAFKIDHIWSIGTTYKISDTGENFGNLYGLAYKHTKNVTGGTMAGGDQAVWCGNGVPKAAMGEDGLWGLAVYDGAGTARQRVYSPNNKQPMIGEDQTWQNLFGSRLSSVTYTNNTGKPITFCVDAYKSLDAYVNNLLVSKNNSSQSVNTFTVIVPAGSTYKIIGEIRSIWMELR